MDNQDDPLAPHMHVWALANQKGGTGKTTTAINLAAALSAQGKRVLLVDLDPQAHASLGLGCDAGRDESIARVFCDGGDLASRARAAAGGFHLVPSSPELAEFEEIAERLLGPERILDQALAEVEGRYDWALLDCPPRADGVLCANAIQAADTALLVVETGAFALQGALRARALFQTLGADLDGRRPPRIRLVATLYDRRTRFARELLVAMQARFGEAMLDTVVRQSVRLREAAAFGVPVSRLDPACRAAADFDALAREVLALVSPRSLGDDTLRNAVLTPHPAPSRFYSTLPLPADCPIE